MAKRTRKITLDAAREEARADHIPLGQDYHALSRDDVHALFYLMDRTAWKLSASSAAMGRSRGYSFYEALNARPRARRVRR